MQHHTPLSLLPLPVMIDASQHDPMYLLRPLSAHIVYYHPPAPTCNTMARTVLD
ncbi:hypothetical protein M405DRAFT_828696 [Rhizopogon salebrosus TDB-379]|nr:hypothetical protein M405DRAFT_828696 [Rhizopogon salebrosus TDB-379]